MLKLVSLQNLAVGYVAIWSISPPLFGNDTARILVIFCALIWLFLEIFRLGGLGHKVTVPILLTFLYVGYTGLFEALLYGPEGLIRQIQIYIMFFFLIVAESRRYNLQSLVTVFWVVLAVYPVWLFITFSTLTTTNAHAARTIVRSSEAAAELMQQGVGGYGLVYGTLLLIPALLSLQRNRKLLRGEALSRLLRMFPVLAYGLVALNIGLGVALVLTAGFTIAVIALVGILLSFFLLEKYNAMRFLFAAFAMIVVAFWAKPLLEATLLFLQPFAEGTNFALKIRDILFSMQVGEASGAASIRLERYIRSLQIFAENPIIGVLGFEDVGKHSQILDGFARWGVFFGGLFVYLISFPAFRAMRGSNHSFGMGLSLFVAITVIFGMNNGFAAAGLILYVMIPVSVHIIQKRHIQLFQNSVVKSLA